jgi:hypothetical protein
MRISSKLALSLVIILFWVTNSLAAETRLWGQIATNAVDEAAGGVEGGEVRSHLSAISFRRSGNRLTKLKATVPIRCVSVDGLVSYHDYYLNSANEIPYYTVRGNRVMPRNFIEEQGDLLLDNVAVTVSGRFTSNTKASFTLQILTDNNGSDQSVCQGSITLSNIRRGAIVR